MSALAAHHAAPPIAEAPARDTPPPRIVSDESLAAVARSGGPDALASFGELVDRYEGRLIGFLARRAASRHDAEDLAQETLLRAWERLGTYDPKRRFSVWLFTIAARVAATHSRNNARRARLAQAEPATPKPHAPARDEPPGNAWRAAERTLDPESLSALWLRYAADLDIREIAAVLGRTSVGVRVLLHRARRKVAEAMEHPDQPTETGP